MLERTLIVSYLKMINKM